MNRHAVTILATLGATAASARRFPKELSGRITGGGRHVPPDMSRSELVADAVRFFASLDADSDPAAMNHYEPEISLEVSGSFGDRTGQWPRRRLTMWGRRYRSQP